MTKLAPEWVRTSDPVIRSPVRYRWTTAPACKMVKKGQRSKQQALCTTSASCLTVETMMEGQCNTVQWVVVSTKWPSFRVQCAKNNKFSWHWKKVKKRSTSKQQILCTTSSSQLTVEIMNEGKSQTIQWVMMSTNRPPWYNVPKNLSFCDLAKRSRKGQNNMSFAQLHHPS